MLTRRVTHKEDITMINAYALNVGVSNFITHSYCMQRHKLTSILSKHIIPTPHVYQKNDHVGEKNEIKNIKIK